MIKERYVSFEVARLLKDKGFNEDYPKGDCTQYGCTQQMACDWIRDKYKIHIAVRFRNKMGYVELIYPWQEIHHQKFFQKMKEAGYEWDSEKKELIRRI